MFDTDETPPALIPIARETWRARRSEVAQLLRLLRRARASSDVSLIHPRDAFYLGLWSLGAFRRSALEGGAWLDQSTGFPVVRDPQTLQFMTIDVSEPLSPPRALPWAPRVCTTHDGESLSVH